MKITIIQISKTKDSYIEDGIKEYLKRISAFAKVEIKTLKEEAVSKTFTREMAKESEGEKIVKLLNDQDVMIALDETGKEFSSVEFAKFLKKFRDEGISICFVIGGPYGLAEKVKKQASHCIALSKMTFTHQMTRIILLEQLYRGLTILAEKEYHI